jgi:hypothetical protein
MRVWRRCVSLFSLFFLLLLLTFSRLVGKVIREGMGQATGLRDEETLDLIITNALIIDWDGIYKVRFFDASLSSLFLLPLIPPFHLLYCSFFYSPPLPPVPSPPPAFPAHRPTSASPPTASSPSGRVVTRT